MIRYDAPFFRAMARVPPALRPRIVTTVESIGADHPSLPTEADETVMLPPSGIRRHRRRVQGTAWWVYYTFDDVDVLIRQVIVPMA